MATTPTEFDDVLNGENDNDTIDGLGGDDRINGGNGEDVLFGGSGDDTIYGGRGADEISGGEGDDNLYGFDPDENGASGSADNFNFSFSAGGGSGSTFSGWLASNNLAALTDNVTTQSFFSVNYTAWLNELVATYGLGTDVDGDGMVSVGLNQNSATDTPVIEGMTQDDLDALFEDRNDIILKTGKTTQERYYSDTFVGSGVTTTNDGNDVIHDFKTGTDTLTMTGISLQDFTAYFDVEVVGDNTIITLGGDSSFSITLMGVTDFDATTDIVFA